MVARENATTAGTAGKPTATPIRRINSTAYAITEIGGQYRIAELRIAKIDASNKINPAYYCETRFGGSWFLDSDLYDSPKELTESLLTVVYTYPKQG